MFDEELENFKTRIDLRQYVTTHGYQKDRRESSGLWTVFRHARGNKIIVHLGSNKSPDHWVYIAPSNPDDRGSILDFVMRRLNVSLGTARKELRPWIGKPPVPVPAFPPPVRMSKDRSAVVSRYSLMEVASRHPYLEGERGIPASVLQSPRFEGRIRIDTRGNAVFPHEDEAGLCGYEIKNAGFTGFSAGGTKGLFLSNQFPDDTSLVLCESGIEDLSHALIFPDRRRARYGSGGGNLSPAQLMLIVREIERMPPGSEVVTAMNADEAGRKLAAMVRQACESVGRADLSFRDEEPFGFKDWNDHLRGKQPDLFPIARVSSPKVG